MKIGILGGTFDPIHYGHIKPAIEVKQQLGLDQIWLMPNHIPPHKESTRVSSKHRLAMATMVCQQYADFDVCDIEVNRDTPSYTAKTLELLTERYPEHQFYFIMGTDSFLQLASWHQWQKLFELCHLVICRRPGWSANRDHPMMQLLIKNQLDFSKRVIEGKTEFKTGQIFPVDVTEQDISSTEIRQQLTPTAKSTVNFPPKSSLKTDNGNLLVEGAPLITEQSLKNKLPPCIQAYILHHQLYQ
ncbi:nicotinate-nucleotide adenylyltransferase [Shewanella donghaensis]|uniref:nicotinate-nucleotide adenylyltransferase n=1 Tax=Shewanella donghaensis TaxID=238836 RepID=UPI001183035E|nr:nicotinate-nucleotide adenylyltransferase [Shewanella donghaensis]